MSPDEKDTLNKYIEQQKKMIDDLQERLLISETRNKFWEAYFRKNK